MDNQQQLDKLYHQLYTGDAVQRNNACNGILKLIEQSTDVDHQDRLRQSIIYPLIDLGRVYHAEMIIEALQKSANPDMQAASYFHRIEFCKKILRDSSQVEAAICEAMAFAEIVGNHAAKADADMEYGRFLSEQGRERDAINLFSDVACYAENHHNPKLLAASKYYIGFCLYRLGHLVMANSFLREATEIAFQERNQILAQTSEVLRFIVLKKLGKDDESSLIFQQWERHFALII